MENTENIIPLGLDITKALKDVQTLKTNLGTLNKEGVRVGRSITNEFSRSAQQSDKLSRNIVQNARTFQQASEEAKKMNSSIRELDNNLNTLNRTSSKTKMGGMFSGMNQNIQQVNKTGSSFLGTLKGIGGALGIAFGVQQVVAFGREIFDIAKRVEGIRTAFIRLGDSEKVLERLRKATSNTVSDLRLMTLAVQASNFKIPMETLAQGLEFANRRARETGVSVDYLVESFVTGLGRKSTMILDNLGLSIVEIQEETRKVGDFNIAVANIIEREMARSGEAVDGLSSKTDRLATKWENFKKQIADGVSVLFADFDQNRIEKITTKINQSLQSFDKLDANARKNVMNIIDRRANAIDSQVSALQKERKELEKTQKGVVLAQSQRNIDVQIRKLKEERVAIQNNLGVIREQNKALETKERIQKNIVSDVELEQKIADLRDRASQIIVKDNASAQERNKLYAEANKLQEEYDKRIGNTKKIDAQRRKEEAEARKRVERAKKVSDELLRLENETLSMQIDLIEDAVTKAVAKETTESQARVRVLEQRKRDFPELVKQINALIEAEELASVARVNAIIKKGEEEQKKEVLASQAEIRKLLKNEYEVQIDDVEAKYRQVIENAKKAGTFSASIEKDLERQKQKEITEINIREQLRRYDLQEQSALQSVYLIKKQEGESQEAFERRNQQKVLEIFIEYSKKRIELLKNDPTKVEEVNGLIQAINKAEEEMKGLKKDSEGDLFDWLGIDPENIKKYSDAVSKFGEVTGELFSALAEGAKAKLEEVRDEIEAIDDLIDKQEEAVKREKDLMDKGFANDYDNQMKTLELHKKSKEQLLKQEEEARKKAEALQRAQIVADSVSQASNLITASTDIFKVFAKIPVVGIPLAIAMIGTMMGAFVATKANALKNTKLAEGGLIGGKSHAQGGNKYVSLDGQSFLEHERGEFVTKKSATQKHRSLLEAINNDDFSALSMNDFSLRELLKGTGVSEHIEVAKNAGERNVTLVKQSRTFKIDESKRLEEIHSTLKDFFSHSKSKAEFFDMGDYIEIRKGNKIERIWKKNINS